MYAGTRQRAAVAYFWMGRRSPCGMTMDRFVGSSRSARTSRSASAMKSARRSRSEEHTSELQSLMRISYAVFCLKKKKHNTNKQSKHKYIKTINPITHQITPQHNLSLVIN